MLYLPTSLVIINTIGKMDTLFDITLLQGVAH